MKHTSISSDLISSFGHPRWTEELRDIAFSILNDLEQDHREFVKNNLPKVLAAAILQYTLETNFDNQHFLIDYFSRSEICLHCGAGLQEMENTCNNIMSLMDDTDKDMFKTVESLKIMEEEEEETEPDGGEIRESLRHRMVVRFPLTSIRKLKRAGRLQALKLAEEIANSLEDILGFTKVIETSFDDRGNGMSITLDIPLGTILLFTVRAKKKGIRVGKGQKVGDSRYDDLSDKNLYRPSDHYLHFIETYVSWGRHEFENDADSLEFLESIKDKTPEELREMYPPSPESQAWLDALKGYDMPRQTSLRELERILTVDPECIEALICRTGWNVDPEARIDQLEDIINTNERMIESTFRGREIPWWSDHRTRPYMRAMEYLGNELIQAEYVDDALEIYAELLELNQNDNQGIRYQILGESLLHHKSTYWNKAYPLVRNEDTPFVLYCLAIQLYITAGNKSAAKKAAVKAFRALPYPTLLLQTDDPDDELLDDMDEHLLAQTVYITTFLEQLEKKKPRTIKWLLNTIEESGWTYGDKEEKGYRPLKL